MPFPSKALTLCSPWSWGGSSCSGAVALPICSHHKSCPAMPGEEPLPCFWGDADLFHLLHEGKGPHCDTIKASEGFLGFVRVRIHLLQPWHQLQRGSKFAPHSLHIPLVLVSMSWSLSWRNWCHPSDFSRGSLGGASPQVPFSKQETRRN